MQTILLLHGAIGAKDQLKALESELAGDFNVHRINFFGHGGEESTAEFAIELFAQQVLKYISDKDLRNVSVFGYSMGGFVAMYIARTNPGKIKQLITLGTKYNWNEEISAKEVKMLDAKKIEEKVPAFANELKQRHGYKNWEDVIKKTVQLLTRLGGTEVLSEADFKKIDIPVLLLSGDRDKMVPPEETLAIYRMLPNACLGILPATPHPIDQVNMMALAFAIRQFMN